LLTHEYGRSWQSSHVDVDATVRPNGYPEQITYRFLDQTWIWDIADKGERADLMPGGPLGEPWMTGRFPQRWGSSTGGMTDVNRHSSNLESTGL
jgi:hypothetical protein